ncbi:MAG TPA: hypothetical protein VM238_11945 [Phycisphaerae bacterium]|nr:hypothetical protein [Phycisphaerae bacterium]
MRAEVIRLVLAATAAGLLGIAAVSVAKAEVPVSKFEVKPEPEPPEQAKAILPLAQVEPVPIADYSMAELKEMFPAFKHEPFETAGFNHLTLPFLYLDRTRDGHEAEALAFSFLLSNSIDWAPGCYCARHAYFTFKRSRTYMRELALSYNPGKIKFAIEDWEATHAVGGTLIKSIGGYAGHLKIYDRTGTVTLQKAYTKPREYFHLLGDMAADAITYFGGKVSPALLEHLRKKRCEHHRSIIHLGMAAFVGEKSEEEFRAYRNILDRDPGFAEVRYWYANQKQWRDADRGHYAAQMERALDAYLVEAAAVDFDPEEHPDPKAAAIKQKQYLARLQELGGADWPGLLRRKLEEAHQRGSVSREILGRATRLAARYPNDHWLLWYLARAYRQGSDMMADCDFASSVLTAAISDRYLVSIDRRASILSLAQCLQNLGRDDLCIAILRPSYETILGEEGAEKAVSQARTLATSLLQSGRYGEARRVFTIAASGYPSDEPRRCQMLALKGIAAAHDGEGRALESVIEEHGESLKKAKVLFLLEGYRDLLDRKPVDPQAVRDQSREKDVWVVLESQILAGQADLLAGTRRWWGSVQWWVKQAPDRQAFRVLYDLYQRRKPSRDDACFYEMLDWLCPFDPWARQAVADFRTRAQEQSLPPPWSPEKVAGLLKGFGTVRYPVAEGALKKRAKEVFDALPPGAVAAVLRTLIRQERFDEAEDLALRHHHMAVEFQSYCPRAYANHLIHLVQQARHKAVSPTRGQTEKQYAPAPAN